MCKTLKRAMCLALSMLIMISCYQTTYAVYIKEKYINVDDQTTLVYNQEGQPNIIYGVDTYSDNMYSSIHHIA